MLAKRRAARPRPAKETSALTELAPIAHEINARLEKAAKMDDKAFDHRLAAALKMEEARATCKRLKITFKKWIEENVKLSYTEVLRLAKAGGSDDPRAALEDLRASGAARQKKHREGQAAAPRDATLPSDEPPAMPPQSLFSHAFDAAAALSDEQEIELVKTRAHEHGMAVLPEKQLKELREGASKIAEVEAGTLNLDYMKEAFYRLKASEKLDFAKFAAAEIGGELKVPDGVDLMPDFLDRKKAKPKKTKKSSD